MQSLWHKIASNLAKGLLGTISKLFWLHLGGTVDGGSSSGRKQLSVGKGDRFAPPPKIFRRSFLAAKPGREQARMCTTQLGYKIESFRANGLQGTTIRAHNV